MLRQIRHIAQTHQELLFQVVLHIVVFIFFAFRKREPGIEMHQVAFFLTFAAAAFVINYVLLPRYFYQKKYAAFLLGLVLVIGAVILMEELVLEPIYFPDTRGKSFPGLFQTLLYDLPVITVLSGFKFGWDAWSKQQEVDALKSAVRENELQFLKSQINPHFLFNNLNNLYAYTIEQSPKAPEIILELSSVLRYMLYECKAEYVLLQKEVEQLKNYIRLSELQIEERGKVHFSAEGVHDSYLIAPLILIVFIENAFKHSTASQAEDIEIDIRLRLAADGKLHFYCRNTFHSETNTDKLSKGIGLENVRKRLKLTYPKAHELTIRAEDQQYEVSLVLQLQKA